MTAEHALHEIRAVYTDETVRVYQAYNKVIAEEAVRNGTFGVHFSMNRMSWIKPSFLWMMYRCGWGEKENQEHILAIDIKRTGFDDAVANGVISSYQECAGIPRAEWQRLVKQSDIRVQWDPEKDVNGENLPYRSVQIGLRGRALHDYVHDWIVRIADITDDVRALNVQRKQQIDIRHLLPQEAVYPLGTPSGGER